MEKLKVEYISKFCYGNNKLIVFRDQYRDKNDLNWWEWTSGMKISWFNLCA